MATRKQDAIAALDAMLAEKAQTEAAQVYEGTDAQLAKYAQTLKSVSKGKPYIQHGNSNFWAIDGKRSRTSIIVPCVIKALVAKGHATLVHTKLTIK